MKTTTTTIVISLSTDIVELLRGVSQKTGLRADQIIEASLLAYLASPQYQYGGGRN
jgi:hypothetical protein